MATIISQGLNGTLLVTQGYAAAAAAAAPCFGTMTPPTCLTFGTSSVTACIAMTSVTKPSPVNFS